MKINSMSLVNFLPSRQSMKVMKDLKRVLALDPSSQKGSENLTMNFPLFVVYFSSVEPIFMVCSVPIIHFNG